jgi:hypothetical protein
MQRSDGICTHLATAPANQGDEASRRAPLPRWRLTAKEPALFRLHRHGNFSYPVHSRCGITTASSPHRVFPCLLTCLLAYLLTYLLASLFPLPFHPGLPLVASPLLRDSDSDSDERMSNAPRCRELG